MKFVSIIMGSKSDYEIMKNCADTFEQFKVKYEIIISSAHRSPERTKEYVKEAEEKGAIAFIAAAGMPVATVALGKAGAINAAYLAMQILEISDKDLAIKLKEDRIVKAKAVESDSKDIEVIL